MRIVSLCPSNTEILACLGLSDHIVGVDRYSDWPPAVRSLPDLGPDLAIDMDRVAALQPSLIVASLSVPGMERNVEQLEDLGIPYLVLNPKRLEDIYDDILDVGAATNRTAQASQLVHQMKERIEEVADRCSSQGDTPRLYWEWWPKPVFSPGGNNWLTDVSEAVSAVNVFADHPDEKKQTDWEGSRSSGPGLRPCRVDRCPEGKGKGGEDRQPSRVARTAFRQTGPGSHSGRRVVLPSITAPLDRD